jgi:hypothetical protein
MTKPREIPPEAATTAQRALKEIERLEQSLADAKETISTLTPLARVAWRDYGAALLEGRKQTASDKVFGEWVKTYGLDAGLAAHRNVRADAMWLAEHWEQVTAQTSVQYTHPSDIRQALRGIGCDWALEQQREGQKPRGKKRIAEQIPSAEQRRSRTALRVASAPADEFERVAESDDPPTVTKLATMGTSRKPAPGIEPDATPPSAALQAAMQAVLTLDDADQERFEGWYFVARSTGRLRCAGRPTTDTPTSGNG